MSTNPYQKQQANISNNNQFEDIDSDEWEEVPQEKQTFAIVKIGNKNRNLKNFYQYNDYIKDKFAKEFKEFYILNEQNQNQEDQTEGNPNNISEQDNKLKGNQYQQSQQMNQKIKQYIQPKNKNFQLELAEVGQFGTNLIYTCDNDQNQKLNIAKLEFQIDTNPQNPGLQEEMAQYQQKLNIDDKNNKKDQQQDEKTNEKVHDLIQLSNKDQEGIIDEKLDLSKKLSSKQDSFRDHSNKLGSIYEWIEQEQTLKQKQLSLQKKKLEQGNKINKKRKTVPINYLVNKLMKIEQNKQKNSQSQD